MRELRLPWPIPTETETILTGGEGGWSRISAPVSLWHPRVSLRQHGGSVEEQAGALHAGKGWERACGSLRQPGGEGGPYRSGPFVMRLPSLVRLINSSDFIHIVCWESCSFLILFYFVLFLFIFLQSWLIKLKILIAKPVMTMGNDVQSNVGMQFRSEELRVLRYTSPNGSEVFTSTYLNL